MPKDFGGSAIVGADDRDNARARLQVRAWLNKCPQCVRLLAPPVENALTCVPGHLSGWRQRSMRKNTDLVC